MITSPPSPFLIRRRLRPTHRTKEIFPSLVSDVLGLTSRMVEGENHTRKGFPSLHSSIIPSSPALSFPSRLHGIYASLTGTPCKPDSSYSTGKDIWSSPAEYHHTSFSHPSPSQPTYASLPRTTLGTIRNLGITSSLFPLLLKFGIRRYSWKPLPGLRFSPYCHTIFIDRVTRARMLYFPCPHPPCLIILGRRQRVNLRADPDSCYTSCMATHRLSVRGDQDIFKE